MNGIIGSVVVLEESPCPRGSSRTDLQLLVLVLVLEPQVLVRVFVFEPQVLVLVLEPQVLVRVLVLKPQVIVLVLDLGSSSPCPCSCPRITSVLVLEP